MRLIKALPFLLLFSVCSIEADAQKFLTDMMDTSTDMGKGMLSIYQKFGSIKFTGYTQPQFQWAEEKGTKTFAGGDFSPYSNNRFTLRRNRIRLDYAYANKNNEIAAYFVFQFDATERGVFARDMWLRLFDNKWKLFHLTTGLFARPFGYELNLSSADRESPERGRMSQTLMKVERDLGAMLSFESRRKDASALKMFKIDLGVFNGPGLNNTTDYDSYKDVIGRIGLKPLKLKPLGMQISGGISGFYGAVGSQSPWLYKMAAVSGAQVFVADSTPSNIDYAAPRHYYGADVQIKIPNRKGFTELRAEYISGTQTGTASSSETPGVFPVTGTGAPQPLYVRPFNGAYFYFLQHLFSEKHQLVVKYDWYDPNSKVSGADISKANGMSAADIKFNTLGIGYVYYANIHLKATLYYDIVNNESTSISGYTSDVKDNVFTLRLQYRF